MDENNKNNELNNEEVIEEKDNEENDSNNDENLTIKAGIEAGQIDSDISENVKAGFLDYAMSVIVSRALPDARDGFKPIHRRIIYSMNESGYTPDKPFVKSAKIIGEVMGKYHPHGDAAIYDAMVRLAQPFSLRYPLVEGHGNFGNIDGDGAAANRYTEARLEKIAYLMVDTLKENTVDFIDNYDGSNKEPVVLPTRIPTLLINGSDGIAVGMATTIPPHNLTEVISGTIAYIKNPEITTLELMNHIKGPDFPTKGEIIGRAGIKKVYETGRGSIVCRGKARIETTKHGKNQIIIYELPYQVNKADLVAKIGELADEKVITGIVEVNDESSQRNGIKIIVDLNKEAVPEVVLNKLYKNTKLQSNFNAQMIALVEDTPKLLNLKDILQVFVKYQEELIERRTNYRLKKARDRVHIIDGLLVATEDIDNVIKLIKESETGDEASSKLQEKYGISEVQAEAILAMTLRRLAGIEKINLENEKADLEKNIKDLLEILSSEDNIKSVIVKELEEIKDKFGDERLTSINDEELNFEDEDLITKEATLITLTTNNYIKRMPIDTFKTQNRGGRGIKGMSTHEDDDIFLMVKSHTHTDVLFFTNFGKVYRVRGYKIPEANRNSKGIPVNNFLNLDENEKVASIISVDDYKPDHYLVFATKKGLIKRTNIDEYRLIRQDGKKAILLRDDDELINVRETNGKSLLCIPANNNRLVKFDENDVRPSGRTSMGVKGINLSDNKYESLGVSTSLDGDKVLVITSLGYGKISNLEDYRQTARGGKGVLTLKESEKRGLIAGIRLVQGDEDLIIITKKGTTMRMWLNNLRSMSRNTAGVKLINIEEGDEVSSVAIVPHQDDEEAISDEVVSENNDSNNI